MGIGKPHPDKRTRLIETAMNLAYRNGFRETSLADIAQAAHVPVGNVYYYFKTKEELGEAVVERRLAQFREFREEIDRLSSPKERLFAFVESKQPLLRRAQPVDLLPEFSKLRQAPLHNGLAKFFLGLKVVVNVPYGNMGGLGDVRQARLSETVPVRQIHGGLNQPCPLVG